jgi:HAD superfamily hydrolase (TIGR01490 family)
MNKLGVFDLDGTVSRDTLTFSVAEELLKQPEFNQQQQKVEEAKNIWKQRGSTEAYWTYNSEILKAFEEICPQVTPENMAETVRTVLKTKGRYTYAYTTSKIAELKDKNYKLVAISGSIKDIVEPFAKALGFDIIVSSELEIADGKYTGKRISQTNKNKDQLLQAIVQEHGLTMEDSFGVGDTHRDISILATVDHPVAFNPNAALYEEAIKRGWPIVIERKNMVYELSPHAGEYTVASGHTIFDDNNQERLR